MDSLSLSDEDFAKLPMPTETEGASEPQEEVVEPKEEETDTEVSEESSEESNEVVETPAEEPKEEVEPVEPTTDYKAVYEELFKPFKANGKEMSVDSVDDIRQLMQMGANYNKKMAALKPNLKVVKMLENNGLLDEAKLSYLIDLDKRNPDAIKKLIKDSGIDPLDIDPSTAVEYKANTYSVNDKEMELDAVLSDIRETDSFNTTIDIIGNKWDSNSKQVLFENPQVIKIINEHVSNGVYTKITNEVDRLRVLGKLVGQNDIEAYKTVGDALYAPKANAPVSNIINPSTSKATNKEDQKLVDKRKAASPTKSVASNTKADFNPLSMSDEEFAKIASSKFI